ncbi:hypothetical protein BGX38DRAFT_1167968 [Terfezia claveryi]|nr:hypothetical protein BGX38DRAFT_1167968 [Terfezia claveryi]
MQFTFKSFWFLSSSSLIIRMLVIDSSFLKITISLWMASTVSLVIKVILSFFWLLLPYHQT